jgi:hypothetical protein
MIALRIQYTRPLAGIAALVTLAAFENDNERGEDHHEGHNGNDDGGHD